MIGIPSHEFLDRLERRREGVVATAESMLMEARGAGRERLSEGEAKRLEYARRDIHDLDERIREYRGEIERAGLHNLPSHGRESRAVNSAGRLAPLGYSDEQLRRAFDQVGRGETAMLTMEQRDPGFTTAGPFVPPELGPVLPVFPRHEQRLLEQLPGVGIDVPQLAYVEVVATTGTAAIVPEGGTKPELLMPASQQVCTARKIACHVGLSWEAYGGGDGGSGDYPAFVSAVQTELLRVVIDEENAQLYGGTGDANNQVNGLATNANILTFTATGTTQNFTDVAGAIATLRTGPALAEPNLFLLHPDTWADLRTQQDQMGRFYVAADPSQDQVEQIWGVPVFQSAAFTPGEGVLLDTRLYGRVVVRESLITRIGYSGTCFTQNIIRFVSEERITQTIERPQAICKITGLPTAAPTTTETKAKK